MKKILFFLALCLLTSGCFLNKKTEELKDPQRVTLYAATVPVSEQLPLAKRYFKGADGKRRAFILTDLFDETRQVKQTYLDEATYLKIGSDLLTDEGLRFKKPGETITAYLFSAQPLGSASVIPQTDIKKLKKSDQRIAKSYQYTAKYIVWAREGTKIELLVGDNGKLIFPGGSKNANKRFSKE